MTKKGIVLSVILSILLIIIAIMSTQKHNIRINGNKTEGGLAENDIALDIAYKTELDLEELKSYKLPILIQIGNAKNEDCIRMQADIEELNKQVRGKAVIKLVDINSYSQILDGTNGSINNIPTQVFINQDGTPLKSAGSELFGYKEIKSEEGEHIYTIHEGDLTLDEMKELLVKMGMK